MTPEEQVANGGLILAEVSGFLTEEIAKIAERVAALEAKEEQRRDYHQEQGEHA
jgi:hypothetical protein